VLDDPLVEEQGKRRCHEHPRGKPGMGRHEGIPDDHLCPQALPEPGLEMRRWVDVLHRVLKKRQPPLHRLGEPPAPEAFPEVRLDPGPLVRVAHRPVTVVGVRVEEGEAGRMAVGEHRAISTACPPSEFHGGAFGSR
jgi:hypothetical protein